MRILHELNQLDVGGAERVVLTLAKYDKENQHMVYSYKDGPMRKELEDAGVKVFIETPKVTHDIEAEIFHVHTGGAPSTIAASIAGTMTVVETIHSPVVSAVRDEWVAARVGVSNQVTKLNRKCRTIYNGIDFSRLSEHHETAQTPDGEIKPRQSLREAINIPNDAIVVGRLGRLGFDKCLEEWLAAAKVFQDTLPHSNVHFLIVGDEAADARGYLAKLKVMAASLPVKNIHFVPAMQDVGWAYESMDIFMYPSPSEGFGLVYMEAMACGVAALLWETELTQEICLGAAYLVAPTVKGLALGLVNLVNSPDVREQYCAEGIEHVQNDFSEELMVEQYQKIYKELKGAEVEAVQSN